MEVAATKVVFGATTLLPKGCKDAVSCYLILCLVVVKKFYTNDTVLIPISYSFSHAYSVSIKCWARSRKRYGYNCFQLDCKVVIIYAPYIVTCTDQIVQFMYASLRLLKSSGAEGGDLHARSR